MDRPAMRKTASHALYPSIEPFDQRMLEVGDGHRLYVEQCGNPDGEPVVVLHGGPGGGCRPITIYGLDNQQANRKDIGGVSQYFF